MKTSSAILGVAVVAALALQGCAGTGAVKESAPAATAAAATPASPQAPAATVPAGVAIPTSAEGKPVVAADTKDHFDAIAAAIRQQMQAGGRFAFVTPTGRATVDGRLDDMATVFNQYDAVAKMPAPAQNRLMTDQNAINEVLARYDSNRKICRNEIPVGSHLPKRVCQTLGQIQQGKTNADQMMRRMQSVGSSNTMNGGH